MSAMSGRAPRLAAKNVADRFSRSSRRNCRGQAFVEFSLVLVVALIVLFVAVQMALLGQAALALGQMNYQGARYAAVHPDCDLTSCSGGEQSIKDFMISVGSPTITKGNGKYLTINVSPAAPRSHFSSVQVSVTFNASSVLVLCTPDSQGNCSFLGVPFPTTLQSLETAMSE
jgi:Flp pilus assembly protein TadG